ncbi:uncharacterized protein LOC106135421 [Amyelois transitella]|uniref:uncharacterized protein LOC106135421 n=1 Tax=Amyelois transitella TaxID=680683 RepID=UPI0029904444|nr:uncharacterized protein LOC106135421 [Amyelois transitella]
MGTTASKDTRRRISFDNNFVVSPVIVPKSIENEDILELQSLTKDASDDLFLNEANTISFDTQEINDADYWSRRIENLKKEHQSINKIIETEYERTVENNQMYSDNPSTIPDRLQKIKPCFDWRTKILKCYEDNPHQPLLCSAAVQAFSQCVKSCRMED